MVSKEKGSHFGFEGKELIRNGAIQLQEKVVSTSKITLCFRTVKHIVQKALYGQQALFRSINGLK